MPRSKPTNKNTKGWLSTFFSRLSLFYKKRRSFTFQDWVSFIGKGFIVYAVAFLTVTVPIILRLQPGQTIDLRLWLIIGGCALLLTIGNYAKETLAVRKKRSQIEGSRLIFSCIGGAIDQLIRLQSAPDAEKIYIINEILKYIEKAVRQILSEEEVTVGEICANIMVKRIDPNRLELVFFGTFLSGRDHRILEINPKCPTPGAVEAYLSRKTMYIDNTMSPRYSDFFDSQKPYRSIISIPLSIANSEAFAILNIDSEVPDQFLSHEFISKRIQPTINPFLSLLKLEKNLLIKSQKISGGQKR